jgi:hypothetical protein
MISNYMCCKYKVKHSYPARHPIWVFLGAGLRPAGYKVINKTSFDNKIKSDNLVNKILLKKVTPEVACATSGVVIFKDR